MKAKFILASLAEHATGTDNYWVAKFSAVTSSNEGNASWSKWTPQGEISMTITNPAAVAGLKVGKAYFLTFEEA